jgi:hypothetical protein
MMKNGFSLLFLLAAGWISALAGQPSANDVMSNRTLWIDPSSMPIAKGKATLSMGMLQWSNGVYSGDYKIKVTPYFFKSQKGTVAIVVSEASLARMAERKAQEFIGTAVKSGKSGKSIYIDAIATPMDIHHGTVKLWFAAGDKKMVFETSYHFAAKQTKDFSTTTTFKNTNDKAP